jgi:tRNA 2-thiouridine synthesizing protein A
MAILEEDSRHQLDARNLLCPLPVIKTQDKAAELNRGDILEVFCTDPGALNDIPAWCRIHGHQVLDANESGDEVIIRLKLA